MLLVSGPHLELQEAGEMDATAHLRRGERDAESEAGQFPPSPGPEKRGRLVRCSPHPISRVRKQVQF